MSFEQTPLLSVLTVNYKSAEKVCRLYESLVNFPPSCPFEFIVVDNHSSLRDTEILNTFFVQKENTHLLFLSQNLGFGRGNEEGLKCAKGDFIAFINPDIEVSAHCLDELLSFLNPHHRTGMVVPLLKTHDGNLLENTWNFPKPLELFRKRLFNYRFPAYLPDRPVPVPWAQGSFLLLRKSFFKMLGGFDHRFFLFFEDTDLCRRSWEMGFQVMQIPTALAFHEEKRLSGHDIFQSLWRKTFWIHVVSMAKYFWKYRGKKFPLVF